MNSGKCTTKPDLAHYFRDLTKSNSWDAEFSYKGVEFQGSIGCDSKDSDLRNAPETAHTVLLTDTDIDTGHHVPVRMYVKLPSNNSNTTCMKELNSHQFFWSVDNQAQGPISGVITVNTDGVQSKAELNGLPDKNHGKTVTDNFIANSTPKNAFGTSASAYLPQFAAQLTYNGKKYRLVAAFGKEHNNRECDMTQTDSNKSIVANSV